MLLKRDVLESIASGEVTLVFRRWKRATVKAGGTLRTPAGMLAIASVERITLGSITVEDAHQAGYRTRSELIEELRSRQGTVYRVRVSPAGQDPLVALRNDTELSEDDVEAVRVALARLDRSSRTGPWTSSYLDLIAAHPRVRAEDLAAEVGADKPRFKANVRKLKRLGLTISHSPGYSLSPRGSSIRNRLARDA